MKSTKENALFFSFLFSIGFSFAQVFQANGDAISLGNDCYRLTRDVNNLSGNIWSPEKVDLKNSFDFSAKLNFGSKDSIHPGNPTGVFPPGYPLGCGADGMVFALQQTSTNVGAGAQGIGYGGITPSVGIEFDTWKNAWDPDFDHIVIEKNGDVVHTNVSSVLAGPVQASPTSGNIKDGLDHWVRVTWDANTHVLSVYFDCELRTSCTIDLLSDIFTTNDSTYWGFTSGTGACNNIHTVCFKNFPTIGIASNNSPACVGDNIQLTAIDISGITYSWTGPNGYTSDQQNPIIPNVNSGNTGTYQVTAKEGNCSLFSGVTTVTINPLPSVQLTPANSAICHGANIELSSSGAVYYLWAPSTGLSTNTGTHTIFSATTTTSYTVTGVDNNGCKNMSTITVTVNPLPILAAGPDTTLCLGDSSLITARGATTYQWQPGSGLNNNIGTTVIASPLITTTYIVTGTDNNGCVSTTASVIDIIAPPKGPHDPIPNIFTPNGDGINDLLKINGNISEYSIKIFDRWGVEMYKSIDSSISWDGKYKGDYVSPGVYYYLMKYISCNNPEAERKGFITVVSNK